MGQAKVKAASALTPNGAGPSPWARYEIEGRRYYQRPLGMLQTTVFLETISGMVLSTVNAWSLFQAIGRRMGRVAAVLLIPEGQDGVAFAKQLDQPGYVEETGEFFGAYLGADQALEVLEDFLSCNRASSVLARAIRVMDRLLALQEQRTPPPARDPEPTTDENPSTPAPNSTGSAPSSVTAIPARATMSSP